MNKPYGLWSNKQAAFVRVEDLTKSPLCPTLAKAVLTWGERDAAQASKDQISQFSGLEDLQVLELREADRPAPEPAK